MMRFLGALMALSLLLAACGADQSVTPSLSSTRLADLRTPASPGGQTQTPSSTEEGLTATTSTPGPSASPSLLTPTSPSGDAGTSEVPYTSTLTTLQIAELQVVARGSVNQVAWSPDGDILAVATSEGIHLYDALTREKLEVLGPTTNALSLDFSPDGDVLVVGGLDSLISWWDPVEGRYLGAFQGHLLGVTSIDYGPSGLIVASGSDDGTVRIWSTALADDPGFIGQETLQVYKRAESRVTQVSFNQNEDRLAIATYGGVHWVDTGTWEPVEIYSSHPGLINGLALSPDQRWLSSAGDDGFLQTWYLFGAGSALSLDLGAAGQVLSLSYSPDGGYFAAGDLSGRILLWETAEGGAGATHLGFHILGGHGGLITSLAFNPSGTTLASSSQDGVVKLWQLPESGE